MRNMKCDSIGRNYVILLINPKRTSKTFFPNPNLTMFILIGNWKLLVIMLIPQHIPIALANRLIANTVFQLHEAQITHISKIKLQT